MCLQLYGGPRDGDTVCRGPIPAAVRRYADPLVTWVNDAAYTYRLAWCRCRRFHYVCTTTPAAHLAAARG